MARFLKKVIESFSNYVMQPKSYREGTHRIVERKIKYYVH